MSARRTRTQGQAGNKSLVAAWRPLRVRGAVRRLLLVLGDQLDGEAPVLQDLDSRHDAILMVEAAEEAEHVPSHRQRTVAFLATMRHFALERAQAGYRVEYVELDDLPNSGVLAEEVGRAVERLRPAQLDFVRPGEWRILESLEVLGAELGVPLRMHEDPHFYLAPQEFATWASGRKTLVLEHFYRAMRRRFDVLVDEDGQPEGGTWNFDRENRRPYREAAPPPPPHRFEPDAVTRGVMRLVNERFPAAPGRMVSFRWPVTPAAARQALEDFVRHRLPRFGDYQDAMVTGAPWMFHSLLSVPLNLKLLNPRVAVAAAIEAYEEGHAPLNAVEGFVRQLIGWREFIRGVYWLAGPWYGKRNALGQHGLLPNLYWTGATEMHCLRQCVGEVLEHGFGHHIQRLMVTGNFALIAGVNPRAISDWYLAMYVDAVDWVTLPNTLGMVMHADGGMVGTKPYAASGRYIERMSDYCRGCRYRPGARTGADACPFTVFYWDFLLRNEDRLRGNRRMALPLKNVARFEARERREIRSHADALRAELGIGAVERSRE
ncbi:MAG: cryptochrome/photolyase family protein [Phycisphaerales bacterium]|nr:cryptochrome/photolyase family protein [Phycisphaerales bacterium]